MAIDYKSIIENEPEADKMRSEIAAGIGQAQNTADDAVDIANEAKSTADNANNRVNNIISGQIVGKDQEVLDAHYSNTTGQTAPNIGARMDGIDSQLADMTQFKLIADIPETTYVTGKSVDYSYIRNRQEYLYGLFYRKLFTLNAVKICCMGDSLTNGQDTVSGDRRTVSEDTTRNLSEAMSSQTIASTTYPEALRDNLQSIYGNQVTVLNRGYSGDWVQNGYNHYSTKHDSDLTILMYGTNDSRATWVPADIRGDLNDYINWYEQLIIREILWGKAVIILTPPKLQTPNDVDIKTFAIALNALGEKYSVPVIDSTEFTANYPSTIYCDSVHFNGEGYKVFASKVTALFVGEGAKKPYKIKSGSTLLTRPNLDNLQYFGGASFSPQSGSIQTPAETDSTHGVAGFWHGTGKGIVYSFYTDEPDLMILPFYYSSSGNFKMTLDFNTASPQNTDDLLVDATVALTETLIKQVTYTTPSIPTITDLIKPSGDVSQPSIIRVSEKGWHTLKIETADSEATIALNAINFMSYRVFKHQRDIYDINKNYKKIGYQYLNVNTTLTSSNDVVLAQSGASDIVLTLPQASTIPNGKILTIIKNDTNSTNVVVQAYSGDTLFGNGTFTGQYNSKKFMCTGIGWVAFV